ncbi:MAG: BACON domain-containing protein [Bacteroidales bacterium]|nr:BACON domain-containing protein [Bacteroidales bacterium]
MKLKLITKLILVVPLLLGGTACQKQTVSEVHDTVVIKTTLAAKTPATLVGGGTDQITISATCDWSLKGEDWFTIEPASGTKGVSESTITTQPNTTGAARIGTIRLNAGSYTSTYTFTQAGK